MALYSALGSWLWPRGTGAALGARKSALGPTPGPGPALLRTREEKYCALVNEPGFHDEKRRQEKRSTGLLLVTPQ